MAERRRGKQRFPIRQWEGRSPAPRATAYWVEVKRPRQRHWSILYRSNDLDRALAQAVKFARVNVTLDVRVWDFHAMKEIWRGKGAESIVEKWKERRPPGMVGANKNRRRGRARGNLHTAEERERLSMAISVMKGRFKGAVSSGRLEKARQIVGWFEGLAEAAAASDSPPFYVKRLRAMARQLERQVPEHARRRRAEPPPEAWRNPSPKIPKAQIAWLMGRVHVGTPDAEIEADIRKRAKGWTEAQKKAAVTYALKVHHDHQKLVRKWRFNPRRARRNAGRACPNPSHRHRCTRNAKKHAGFTGLMSNSEVKRLERYS